MFFAFGLSHTSANDQTNPFEPRVFATFIPTYFDVLSQEGYVTFELNALKYKYGININNAEDGIINNTVVGPVENPVETQFEISDSVDPHVAIHGNVIGGYYLVGKCDMEIIINPRSSSYVVESIAIHLRHSDAKIQVYAEDDSLLKEVLVSDGTYHTHAKDYFVGIVSKDIPIKKVVLVDPDPDPGNPFFDVGARLNHMIVVGK
jgi:hypothetical protein